MKNFFLSIAYLNKSYKSLFQNKNMNYQNKNELIAKINIQLFMYMKKSRNVEF